MQQSIKDKLTTDNILLLLIITVASILRFWNYSEMPFMNDELTALLRAQGNTFKEVVNNNMISDVHPVGVAVFVHYWSLWFGQSEMVIKFPFILMSIASIYFSYQTAKKWFNSTVGLMTASFIASLQFTTMYGQLERPYASGMFFTSITVWCWTNFFFGDKRKQVINIIGFVLFASLCTYNHYFNLLFAALVGGTGLFFINKKNALMYLSGCVLAVVLFIPHIHILLYRLAAGNGGGDDWLGKPQPDWFWTFIKYLFHYSYLVFALVISLIIIGFIFKNKVETNQNKFRFVCLLWVLTLPAFAYVYSIVKTPLLQFSIMTFALPFLFMFLFSFYVDVKKQMKIVLVLLILSINTYSLFATRKHNIIFYKQPYQEMVLMGMNAIKEHGDKDVTIAYDVNEGFLNYYFEKYNSHFNFLRVDKPDTKTFSSYVKNQSTNYFVAGNLPLEYFNIIKESYPYLIKKVEGFTTSIYCYSKQKPSAELPESIVYSKKVDLKSFGSNMDSTMEYSKSFTEKVSVLTNSPYDIITVSTRLSVPDSTSNPTLVMDIQKDGKSVMWNGAAYQSFNNSSKSTATLYITRRLFDLNLKKHPNAELKVYIWNRDKKFLKIEKLKIEVTKGNSFIYGLYEPLE